MTGVARLCFRAVTARKRAVRALRESESKYRGLIASLSGEYLLYRRELEGPMTYLSPSVEHMTGYTPAELEGPWIGHLTDHPLNQSALETSRRALEGAPQEPFDIEIRVKSGDIKRLRVSESPLFNPQGQVVAVQGIAQDVTELHRTRVLLDRRSRVLERLARGRPQAEVLEAITAYIAEAQPGAMPAVYVLDQDGPRLSLGAAPALPAHFNRALDPGRGRDRSRPRCLRERHRPRSARGLRGYPQPPRLGRRARDPPDHRPSCLLVSPHSGAFRAGPRHLRHLPR